MLSHTDQLKKIIMQGGHRDHIEGWPLSHPARMKTLYLYQFIL